MDPNKIELEKLSKEFEYVKIANEIDSCESVETLKNIAKSYAKLYFKQQEVVSNMGL
jgi:uncharacterized membrane-anchored protein YhcB (DUF1043 family)